MPSKDLASNGKYDCKHGSHWSQQGEFAGVAVDIWIQHDQSREAAHGGGWCLSDCGLWESSTSLLHLWKDWHSSLFCPSKTVTGQGNTDGEKEAGTYQDQVQKMESSHSHSSTDDSGEYCSWLHVKLNPHRKQRRDAGVTPKSLKLAAGDKGGSCFEVLADMESLDTSLSTSKFIRNQQGCVLVKPISHRSTTRPFPLAKSSIR